jgi:putative hydrolase of the HAD superfamily
MRSWCVQPRALLVDLDDTLLDGTYQRTSLRATCAFLASQPGSPDETRLMEANAEVWKEYWPEVEGPWVLGVRPTDDVRDEIWRRTLHRCGCDDGPLALLAARTHARIESESYRLFDDARRFLEMPPMDLPLGLVTNGPSDLQREKINVLGIEHRFSVIVVSGEVGFAKPDPRPFLVALQSLSVAPAHAWHVGDSMAMDVAGADAAGVRSVWLNRRRVQTGTDDRSPTIEIHSLDELSTQLMS